MKNISARNFWICIALGIIFRFMLMSLGYNFDFKQACVIGEIAAHGKNVYANTEAYNYGPGYFSLLGVLWKIASHFKNNVIAFRILFVSTLTLADFFIAKIISRKVGNFWGAVFFLNPISLIITGYHNQFDNLAVCIAALGVLCVENSCAEKEIKFSDLCGIILLSLSFITKHILWTFPLWILLNQNINTRKKILYAFIPPMIFFLSFVPYWSEGSQGIIQNVFLYAFGSNYPLFAVGLMNYFGVHIPFQRYIGLPIFALLMLAGAYAFRREKIFNLFALYTIALLCFSSAVGNQYLVIPCMALVLLFKKKSFIYFVIGFIFLSLESQGLHIPFSMEKHFGTDIHVFGQILSSGIFFSLLVWCLLYYLASYRCRHQAKS